LAIFFPHRALGRVPVFQFFKVFGGDSEEETPVPIPNTAVKLFSADGTARETVWESRTPPKFILRSPSHLRGAFFLLFREMGALCLQGFSRMVHAEGHERFFE
jgi:hypothetical protein